MNVQRQSPKYQHNFVLLSVGCVSIFLPYIIQCLTLITLTVNKKQTKQISENLQKYTDFQFQVSDHMQCMQFDTDHIWSRTWT